MKIRKTKNALWPILMLFFTWGIYAHPSGNMITVGEHVLWPYINPISDPDHYACVMIWKKGAEPKVLIQSEYAASDYMLYNNENEIYIIERKYLQLTDHFEVRVLKTTVETKPEVIWDWFKDDHRIGEGGFFMLSDNQMVFGRYPEIYALQKGKKPRRYFKFDQPIKRIRAVGDNQILLLGDSSCYLAQQDGTILQHWDELIEKNVEDAPLDRNQVFDADYSNGELLLSYWGKRSFVTINANGKRENILEQSEPLAPHWVAFLGNGKLLFSSELILDGSTPRPYLVHLNGQNDKKILWSMP